MSTLWEDIRYKVIHSGSKLNLLIGINVAVFVVFGLLGIIEKLTTTHTAIYDLIYSYTALPSYLPKLLVKFWTPVTYMFMHDGIFHILFNMLWFFWIGQIFEEYLGGKKLLTLYFLGGLAGAFVYVLSLNVFPLFADIRMYSTVVGASAAVMAIIVGTATLLPDYTIFMMFFGAVKLKWLAVVYVLIDLLSVAGPNGGGEMSHIGGAIIGFIYIKQLRSGNDWGKSIEKVFQPASASKLKVASKNTTRAITGRPKQEEVDGILDKISKSGYDSLTRQEKDTLFRASNDDKS